MKESWKKLSSVDCSKHIEKKGNLSYLSWAWAWSQLCDNYPDSTFEFEKTETGSEFWSMPDGSGEVRCSLTVSGTTRTCWLPVMDYKNKAIPNPNARDVNDAKMRCLVKAIALFGLGLYIYAGEDIPSNKPRENWDVPLPDNNDVLESELPSWRQGKIPIGKNQGKYLGEMKKEAIDVIWEHRAMVKDYPDFMSSLQQWRKSL
tara:strand:- start:3827 stop:4435 length:609 start_codon:yes stop_codon:yes gene_type:complete